MADLICPSCGGEMEINSVVDLAVTLEDEDEEQEVPTEERVVYVCVDCGYREDAGTRDDDQEED